MISNRIWSYRQIVLAGAAAIVLAVVPVAYDSLTADDGMLVKAFAQGGQGQGQGQGSAGRGRGGPSGGGGGIGVPGGTGGGQGGDGGGTTGSGLGRLNMGRAFVAPGFDITRVDDPLAPVAQVYTYKTLIEAPLPADDPTTPDVNETELAIKAAGTALGNAATVIPITYETIVKLNTLIGTTTSWSETALTDLAAIATKVVEDRRTEEGETESTTPKVMGN